MSADISLSEGGVSLRVTGLNRALRALASAGADAADMRDLMHSIGENVARTARARTPVRTGALRASIRAGRGKTKAVVRAGYKHIPYGPVIHYGWPARRIPARPFLAEAVRARHGDVVRQLADGIQTILDKNNL